VNPGESARRYSARAASAAGKARARLRIREIAGL
jgi:hypothetical protein